MVEILNTILANQQKLNPDLVMKKLDEILKDVNPNRPLRTYRCNGEWSSIGPGRNAFTEITAGGSNASFEDMRALNNSGQYLALLKKCESESIDNPGWLTPKLFCSLADLGLGDKEKARSLLKEFNETAGPAYEVEPCSTVVNFLKAQIGN